MSERFSIRQRSTPRKPGGGYSYDIFDRGQYLGRYWTDSIGDDHGIDFQDGRQERWPVGRSVDFLIGGGSTPKRLSEAAVAFLTQIVDRRG